MNYISVGKAAKILHVSTQSIRKYVDKEMFRSITTPGGHRKLSEEDVLKYASEMEHGNKMAAHLHAAISLKDSIPEAISENKEENFE